jgi:hypothetical protein
MYTNEMKKDKDQEIFFLNDNNIAFDKKSTECSAGFNAIASQREFVEAYEEFEAISSDFCALSASTGLSVASLDSDIKNLSSGLSTEIDDNFLKLSGGTVDKLNVKTFIVDNHLSITDNDISINLNKNRGHIDIKLEDGLSGFYINDKSLD